MSKTTTVQVRLSEEWKARLSEIAARAEVPQRYVLDRLVQHYGGSIETKLMELSKGRRRPTTRKVNKVRRLVAARAEERG